MFIPRSVQLKLAQKRKRSESEPPAKAKHAEHGPTIELPVQVSGTKTDAQVEALKDKTAVSGSSQITHTHLAIVRCAVELVFTDYALQDPEKAEWLQHRYRVVNDQANFIHISALLDHPNLSNLKPASTQTLIQRALRESPSEYLELSANAYYVRRRPETHPLPFVPKDSFNTVDDHGLSFWDQRTIYVEPHTRDLCKTQAKVAHFLQEHGCLKEKWLPIQAVETLYNSCAFVVLSGNVTHEDQWNKWSNLQTPPDWKVMTKVEHAKRTQEYLDLKYKEAQERKTEVTGTDTTKIGEVAPTT